MGLCGQDGNAPTIFAGKAPHPQTHIKDGRRRLALKLHAIDPAVDGLKTYLKNF